MFQSRTFPWLTCGGMALLAAMMAPQAVAQDQSQLLRWNLKPEQEFEVKITQTSSQSIEVEGEKPSFSTEMRMYMTWHVDAVDTEGVATMTQTTDRIAMEVDMPTGKLRYDSADPGKPEGVGASIAGMMGPLVGMKTVQRMNSRGEILEVKMPEQILKNLKASPVGQAMTEKSFGDMLRQTSPTMPVAAVKTGATWEQTSETTSIMGRMKMVQTLTYQGPEQRDDRPVERISLAYTLAVGNGDRGPRVRVTRQDNQGAILFDNVHGYLAASQVQQSMSLITEIQDQSIVQEIASTVRMTVEPITR